MPRPATSVAIWSVSAGWVLVAAWSRIRDQDGCRDHVRDQIRGPPMTGVVLALAVIGAAAGYWIACAFWPFGPCLRCHGSGQKASPSGKFWRPCRRCKGTGTRVRTGRRVWQWLAGQKDAAR